MRLIAALSAFCLFATSVAAEPVYLTAASLADPASGRIISNPVVVIDNGKVTSVGNAAAMTIPADAEKIDLGARTILPGLIDMHVHLTSSATKGRGYDRLGYQKERRTIWGVMNAQKTLMAGFTTVRDVGSRDYATVALRESINEGEIPGPRLFVSGPPVGIVGGHCSDVSLLPPEFNAKGLAVATGPWEMREQVRENIKYGVDLIKTCSTGGVFSKGTTLGAAQGTVEELTAIVEEAHARGLKVASHAHGAVGIKNAITAGVDTIEHASFMDDEAIRMAKRAGTYLSMDIYNTEYTLAEGEKLGVREESLAKERQVGEIQRNSFTKAVQAGVKVVFGSDAAIYPHGDNANQLSRMVRFGMTPVQAVQAATVVAAEALGQEDSVGSIKAGASADIIAVDGNPFEDVSVLENVSFVMKEGVIYKD
ncbi:amidohydrolase family protein [Parvularcula sp. IMCC14364]|uniref:Xaa-Pro dipeptidase n=1 Tax=Parvularcula sp. IMCC14364 TaxID=3067902 RepID=UPI002741CB33|nr:amidohydrolase family protein [Parvularcula sp. IMCC14364]